MSEYRLASVPDPVPDGTMPNAPVRPVARTPISPAPPVAEIGGWEVSARHSAAELRLSDQSPLAKVQVKAPWAGEMARGLGVGHGRAAFGRAVGIAPGAVRITAVIGSGPGEWLVFAPVGESAELVGFLRGLAAEVAGSELVTVVDLTYGRALIALTGSQAPGVLARVCALDLSERVTPDGTAFRTSVASVVTDVIYQRCDSVRESAEAGDMDPSYLLHCERSSGQYLFDVLYDAGAEFGIDIDGFRPAQH